MHRRSNINAPNGLIVATLFMIAAWSHLAAAEEYVWVRFYGANPRPGYATDGFGSYYVPKSMAASKLQTDAIKKSAESKSDGKKAEDAKPADTKPADAVVETPPAKPTQPPQKSVWKRLTFRK